MIRICEIDGCENEHRAKGLCMYHYKRTDAYRASTKKYNNTETRKSYMKDYCQTEKYKEHEKLPKRKAKCKAFDSSEAGKESRARRRSIYNGKHPERVNARIKAARNIKRQECEVVGCVELGERHHDDYSEPLEVRFLCRAHHLELHKVA